MRVHSGTMIRTRILVGVSLALVLAKFSSRASEIRSEIIKWSVHSNIVTYIHIMYEFRCQNWFRYGAKLVLA